MRYMYRSAAFLAGLLLLFFLVTPPLQAQDGILVTKAAGDLYFLTGTVGNVAVLVTDEGVLAVDSGTKPSQGEAIIGEIAKLTDGPVRYLVYTHYHLDHTGGASGFPEGVTIVAHENLPLNMKKFNEPRLKEMIEVTYPARIREAEARLAGAAGAGEEELAAAEAALAKVRQDLEEARKIRFIYPDRTYSDETTIELGGHTVRLVYPGPAHTSGNTIVHFVDLEAVHVGDILFFMHHPYIDWKAGSDTKNWIAALGKVKDWDVETVMPGHGDLTGRDGLEWMIGYLTELRSEVGVAIRAGMNLEETQKAVKMEKYADIPWTYMLDAGREAVFNELTGAER